ncbi:MAG TPA: cation:dicarboxylase symporter family transporter [Sphingomicrobium sp.]
MTKADSKPAAENAAGNFRAYYALAALVLGIVAGMFSGQLAEAPRADALAVASFIGTLWLNALKMTVIPLVVALLVVGIAKSAEAAHAGRIAGKAVFWIVVLCSASAVFGAVAAVLLTHLFPLARSTAELLQVALGHVEQTASGPLPGVADFFKGIVPSNVIAAASNGDILPLTVFSTVFALALTRVAETGRKAVVALFDGVAEALLIVIAWVLAIAPLGVFALAFTVGSAAGGAAFAGLGHYVAIISAIGILVTLIAYPMAPLLAGVPLGRFARELIPPQAVAISTRSSLASLPAMLTASRSIGIREEVGDVTLPIAVALYRMTGPAMNVAVAFYVAHWLGLQPSLAQMIAATAVGAVMSYGAVSLPGEVSYISSIAPIALALGVPIAPLGLLVAVEMVPDIFRTVGNVTHDVALAAVVDRGTRAGG